MNTQRFSGKAVVVTDAAQDIDRDVAVAAAEEGTHVPLVGRAELIHEVQTEIAAVDGHAHAITADLEAYADVQHAVQTVLGAFGRIDVPVNNVGGTIWAKPYQHYEEAQIEAEIHRLLFPALWCCRVVLPHMAERKQGVIVSVSSITTRDIYRIPYSAARSGVNALTVSLASEHADDNIRVNTVATGDMETPPRKIPRNTASMSEQETVWYQGIIDQTLASSLIHCYGTIDEQIRVIPFLALSEASYVAGTVLLVDDGDLG